MGCVYCVTNKINGKKYIGKTIGIFAVRKSEHKNAAKKGSSLVFHRALRKYGFDSFEWVVEFESDNDKVLCKVEISEIKYWNTKSPNGYNVTDGGEGTVGFCHKHSKETREKISKTLTGKKHTEETKEKIRIGNLGKNKGKKHTEECKRKISDAHKGKILSEETKKKMSEFQKGRERKPPSEEAKKKMSISQKNRIREPHSEETKKKMSLSQKGRNQGKSFEEIHGKEKAKEIKEKMSNALKGRIFSEEHRRNLSIVGKRRFVTEYARS